MLAQCDIKQLRRSGPGGQHRNKAATAIEFTHRPTGVMAEANEQRQQQANHSKALIRLRRRLALEIRCEPSDEPSDLWRSRCHKQKFAINPNHKDFPVLLAEALDRIYCDDCEVSKSARLMSITTSQLIKFLKLDHDAFELVNHRREKLGKRRLQ